MIEFFNNILLFFMPMKKLIISLMILWLGFGNTFADEKEIEYIISPEYSGIEQFYKINLKETEIEEIKKIYDSIDQIRLNCIAINDVHCNWNLQTGINTFYNDLKKYIDTKNISKYNEYILKNSNLERIDDTFKYKINFEKKYKDPTKQKESTTTKILLTEKQKETIKKQLEKLNEDQFTLIENKINNLLRQTTNGIEKSILNEILEIINETKTDKIIKDIFNI